MPQPAELETAVPAERPGRRERIHRFFRRCLSWAGYAWFMSFGTILPLPTFLLGYVVHVTLVGAPVARAVYRLGIFLSTFGLAPPGAERLEARQQASTKKPFVERIQPYSPPGLLARHGRPVGLPLRAVWFVLVGWWLGGLWVILSWSVLLLPYPMLGVVAALLDELPSVMTLAWPREAEHGGAVVQAA